MMSLQVPTPSTGGSWCLKVEKSSFQDRRVTLNFNGSRRRGRAMVINCYAGVDACVLRHDITNPQQDVTSVPGQEVKSI